MAASTVGLINNWFPPNRENYDFIISVWQWFPLAASLQWLVPWYGMGKTSVTSRLNLPGRIGWLTMEAPGFLTLLYHLRTLPSQVGSDSSLPWQNQVLAALFVIHYAYRALLFPFLQPSMSPLHLVIWLSGLAFQVVNGTALGAWLAAYYRRHPHEDGSGGPPAVPTLQFAVGIALFYLGLVANYYHDEELREIRRRELARRRRARLHSKDDDGDNNNNNNKNPTQDRNKRSKNGSGGDSVDKHYEIPQAGLFRLVLYPHYLAEWVEWLGFWMAAGWACAPARCFVLNEVAAMLPRAVRGRRWYAERFGEERIRGRWAVIPGVW